MGAIWDTLKGGVAIVVVTGSLYLLYLGGDFLYNYGRELSGLGPNAMNGMIAYAVIFIAVSWFVGANIIPSQNSGGTNRY